MWEMGIVRNILRANNKTVYFNQCWGVIAKTSTRTTQSSFIEIYP